MLHLSVTSMHLSKKGGIILDHYDQTSPQTCLVLAHHGILGQKWGVRRYQNADGSWTSAGKRRYGGNTADEQTRKRKSQTRKKVAVGVAAGAATAAGVVLTAYLVKKIGSKNLSELANKVETGKETVEKVMRDASLAPTPVSRLPTVKALQSGTDSGKAAEKFLESRILSTSTSAGHVSALRVSADKPNCEIPNNYNFETLMKQNQELLKKMYADLAS